MKLRQAIVDMAGLAGLLCVGFGLWQIYPPSAFVVCGCLMIAYAVRASTGHSA